MRRERVGPVGPRFPQQVAHHVDHASDQAILARASRIILENNIQIGDFRIERRLGAGGMGVVYLRVNCPSTGWWPSRSWAPR